VGGEAPARRSPAPLDRVATPSSLLGRIDWLDAQAVLDELGEDQIALGMRLAGLEHASRERAEGDPRTSARDLLRELLPDLAGVVGALAELQRAAVSRHVQRAFLPDAPLADYARGVYAWTHAVVRALDALVV